MPKKQIPVALAVITNEQSEIFLTQRNDPGTPEHLKWEFPGGKIEFGEEAEDTVVREVKEETGFEIEVLRLLPKVYSNMFPPTVDEPFTTYQAILLAYHCRVIGGEFKPLPAEVIQGKYFKKSEIDYSVCIQFSKEIIELLDK